MSVSTPASTFQYHLKRAVHAPDTATINNLLTLDVVASFQPKQHTPLKVQWRLGKTGWRTAISCPIQRKRDKEQREWKECPTLSILRYAALTLDHVQGQGGSVLMQGETKWTSHQSVPCSSHWIIPTAEPRIGIPLHPRSFPRRRSRTICPFGNRAGKTQEKVQASLKQNNLLKRREACYRVLREAWLSQTSGNCYKAQSNTKSALKPSHHKQGVEWTKETGFFIEILEKK